MYWPFDPNKVVSETYNASTEIHLTTLDNVHVSPGDLEAQFTIDFTNDGSDPEENWPRGTCNGPFPIGGTCNLENDPCYKSKVKDKE